MKKKLPLIIGIVAIVIALIIAIVVLVMPKQEAKKEINLEEVSNKITENSHFKEMATEGRISAHWLKIPYPSNFLLGQALTKVLKKSKPALIAINTRGPN